MAFRNQYLTYAELTAQLQRWAATYPEFASLRSLGKTPGGRDIWLLVVGHQPERIRPAVWVDGNMHAIEFAGSSVALAIAEELLGLLAGHPNPALGLSPQVAQTLRDTLFYIVPRVSPDGAECVLTTGEIVRSVPRDQRVERGAAKWRPADLDGDGQVHCMRVQSPAGELVESPEVPGLLVERNIDDAGPFYKLYPEGIIENFDGHNVPATDFLGHAPIDLNRNFPWSWRPPHQQVGAGEYPASEPETRAIVEFATAHPEIMVWLDLHTFGGVAIRPLGHDADSKLNQTDLAIFRQLEAWMTQFTTYPTVSGYHEFLYAPDQPLHGDLTDFAYNQRGALAYVVELWDLFARLQMPKPAKFVDYYAQFGRAELTALARWDQTHNDGRIMRPWRQFQHPQLGTVELGGFDPRVGLWNPSFRELPTVCLQQCQAFLRVAALVPRLQVSATSVTAVGHAPRQASRDGNQGNDDGDALYRVTLRVDNVGYLPSYGLPSAKPLTICEPLYATLRIDGGALCAGEAAHRVVGHLAGWGQGRHSGQDLPAYPGTTGSRSTAWLTILLAVDRNPLANQASATLHARIGSARTGFVELEVPVEATA